MDDFEAWVDAVAEHGELTPEIERQIVDIHGDRGRRALEAVEEQRIKQYLDFIVVVGHSDEYIVEGERCDCLDARYNLDRDDPSERCWHELAVIIAARIDGFDHHELWYTEVRDLV